MAKALFKEKQRSVNKVTYFALFGLIAAMFYGIVHEIMSPTSEWVIRISVYIALMMFSGAAIWYYRRLSVKVAIDKKAIHVKMKPIHKRKKHIPWKKVQACEIVKTSELSQWQGGNISFNHERRYSLCGRNGLHIILNNGEEYFLGSRKPGELRKVVSRIMKEK